MGIISDNINNVMTQVKEICEKKGQDYNNVTVIAVTKTIDTARIKEAIDSGITDIGENKVQEIMDKYEDVKDIANIHLIGHLQSNKIKYIIDRVKLIHSVDSLSLMKEIDKRAAKADVIANILIQVNVAEEESKFGIKMDEVEDFMIIASQYNNIRIKGLMTIAPYAENPEDVRLIFRALKEKYDKLTSGKYKNVEMKYLSMGMTNDYHVALEEGSNMVRIGTGIFGKRIYNR